MGPGSVPLTSLLGTEKIAFAIANNTKCVYLSLWSNNIAQKGAEAIAYALGKNKNLTELDLNSNKYVPFPIMLAPRDGVCCRYQRGYTVRLMPSAQSGSRRLRGYCARPA